MDLLKTVPLAARYIARLAMLWSARLFRLLEGMGGIDAVFHVVFALLFGLFLGAFLGYMLRGGNDGD